MTSTSTPPGNHSLGIDVGGTGVKGGIVDLDTGLLVGERFKLPTPQPSTPDAVAMTVAEVVAHFGWHWPVGVTYPGVIVDGVVRTAANVDESWLGTNVAQAYSEALGGRPVTVLNDADAAGLAEQRFGAGRNHSGVIVLLTFGTGIGSAVIHNGQLLPNTEFGHLEVGGKEAEHRAAASVRERKEWSYKRWTREVSRVLVAVENAVWPDLIIAGGGVSRKGDKWIPLLTNRTPVVAAELQNTAGIVGAAMVSAGAR
ncbi:MAG: ROK family protein [Mycolicibacterium insubricum]|nr:ROK family protein [Mycobacterium sp.]